MAAEEQLLIFEGASAGRYPQRSRPSEQRHNDERREPRRGQRSIPKDEPVGRRRGKNRQMASALRVAEIQAKGHKAFGFVAWHGGQLCWLGALLARPLLRIRYGSPCGDARAKPPCPRPVLPATASMRFNQRFPNVRRSDQADRRGSSRPCCWRQASCHRGWSR